MQHFNCLKSACIQHDLQKQTAVDELTLKVTVKLHEPRSKTKELVSWTPLGALSTTPAQYLCICVFVPYMYFMVGA